LVVIAYFFAWQFQNPFQAFERSSLDSLGIPEELLDFAAAHDLFGNWKDTGKIANLSILAAIYPLFISFS
jgi:hypothetical protein